VHVTDVRRSALWYQRVLGYRPAMEFTEADRVVGYGFDHSLTCTTPIEQLDHLGLAP
jgi:hypothetical protein